MPLLCQYLDSGIVGKMTQNGNRGIQTGKGLGETRSHSQDFGVPRASQLMSEEKSLPLTERRTQLKAVNGRHTSLFPHKHTVSRRLSGKMEVMSWFFSLGRRGNKHFLWAFYVRLVMTHFNMTSRPESLMQPCQRGIIDPTILNR